MMVQGTGADPGERPRSRRKDKGAASDSTPDTGRPQSRRTGKGAQPDQKPPKKPLLDRRQLITGAIALSIVILVFLVTQKDGGAPQTNTRSINAQPTVEAWTYKAAPEDGNTVVLCTSETDPCDADSLWRHQQEGSTCTLAVRIWLASSDMPIVLRGVTTTASGTAWSGDYTATNDTEVPINLTTIPIDQEIPWDNGWWWRIESENVRLQLELPCDVHSVTTRINVTASTLDGDPWTDTQSATVSMHQAFLSKLGQAPRTPNPA